jgi:hypothetical protein
MYEDDDVPRQWADRYLYVALPAGLMAGFLGDSTLVAALCAGAMLIATTGLVACCCYFVSRRHIADRIAFLIYVGFINGLAFGMFALIVSGFGHPGGPDFALAHTIFCLLPTCIAGVPVMLIIDPMFNRRREFVSTGYCHTCGYNLTGNVTGRCPECGQLIPVESSES